jgi:hypothetical protein
VKYFTSISFDLNNCITTLLGKFSGYEYAKSVPEKEKLSCQNKLTNFNLDLDPLLP